jgi:hypothetical protein
VSHQHRTTKHEVIRQWAEQHRGVPALVRTTMDALRIKIGEDEPSYEPITWEKWFEIFDANSLAFLYEEPGYMNKIVRRNERDEAAST